VYGLQWPWVSRSLCKGSLVFIMSYNSPAVEDDMVEGGIVPLNRIHVKNKTEQYERETNKGIRQRDDVQQEGLRTVFRKTSWFGQVSFTFLKAI